MGGYRHRALSNQSQPVPGQEGIKGWSIENVENTSKRCDFSQGGLSTTPSFGHPSCLGGEVLFSVFSAHFRRFSKNLPL